MKPVTQSLRKKAYFLLYQVLKEDEIDKMVKRDPEQAVEFLHGQYRLAERTLRKKRPQKNQSQS